MQKQMVKKLFISIACLLAIAQSGFAQDNMDVDKASQKQVNEAMMTDSPHEDDFYVARAHEYIDKRKDYFQIANFQQELKFEKIMHDPPPFTNVSVSFYQVVNDIPVERATIGVSFRQNGKVFSSGSSFEPGASHVNTTPSVSKEQAVAIALKDERAAGATSAQIAELVIGKFDDEFKLTWKIFTGGPKGFTDPALFYIDAQSGELLKYEFPGMN